MPQPSESILWSTSDSVETFFPGLKKKNFHKGGKALFVHYPLDENLMILLFCLKNLKYQQPHMLVFKKSRGRSII